MNLKRWNIFLLISVFILWTYADDKRANLSNFDISLDIYNAISNTYDSLNQSYNYNIDKKVSLKTKIHDLKEKILTFSNRNVRDTLNTNIDSILILKNKTADSIKEKQLIEKLNDYESQIEKTEKEIEVIQRNTKAQKEKLDNESVYIKKCIKKYNGSLKLSFQGVDYNVFVANRDSCEINMHWKNYKEERGFQNIQRLLNYLESQKNQPLMITNAGMYTPSLWPQGLFVDNRKEVIPIDSFSPKTDANFYLKPNGVFYIDTLGMSHIEITEDFQKRYQNKKIGVKYATQSGPMLLINGNIHHSFSPGSFNKKIRSGVGIIDNKRTVFAISLDEANFYDFARLFRDIFGCQDALFLDGAISLMYLKDIAPNILGGQFGPMISVTPKNYKLEKLPK